MAFDQDNFAPIGAQATKAPTAWSYKTTDLIDSVKAAGYFDSKRFSLEEGDTIWVDAGDESALLKYISNEETAYVVAPRPVYEVLAGLHLSDQQPLAVDTPTQVAFGGGATALEATLDANGTLTILEEGIYNLLGGFNVGRSSNSGEALHIKWLEVNGVQAGNTIGAIIQNVRIAFTQQVEFTAFFPAGSEIKLFQARDSQGVNDGGLFVFTPTLPLNVSPSASIRVTKFG